MTDPHDPDRPGIDTPARQAGQIPTEHGLEAVPSDTRRPLVAPILGGALVLAILGWLIFGPSGEVPQPRSAAEAPAAQPPAVYRAPSAPGQ